MISRREFMAGSDALAASSAPTRLAPGPESIWINDVHSQLNPTRAGNFTATVTGRCAKRGSCRAQRSKGNLSCEWAARDFLSTSARSPSGDFLFVNTYPAFSRAAVIAVSLTSGQTMEAWFCRMFALCQVCSTPLGNQPLLAAPDRCPPTSLGCPSIFGRGIALASLASDSSSS